jgi:hypothetical protein
VERKGKKQTKEVEGGGRLLSPPRGIPFDESFDARCACTYAYALCTFISYRYFSSCMLQ